MLKNGKRVCAAGRQYYVLFAFQKQNFQICTKLKLHGIGIVHQNQGGVLAATAEYPSACLQIFATKNIIFYNCKFLQHKRRFYNCKHWQPCASVDSTALALGALC